ncbi:MAG: biosynthetic arginine decarboxylase [Vibrionaceae bacterium]
MSASAIPQALNTYNVAQWGVGYFDVDANGDVTVRPDPQRPTRINLAKLAREIQAQGTQMPILLSFSQILQHRLSLINNAFASACENFGYENKYMLVYPIKVNQQRRVVESLLQAGQPLGLEAGSKAELMTVLGYANQAQSLIVCNGYKDREYIRTALIGEKLGHKVYLVIEKLSEIAIVLEEARRLDVKPRLGVRARLASQGSGKWQSSGGEKSKFGLSAEQVLQLVDELRAVDSLDSLQLLHFHLGSQLSNIRDIATGVRESARFYVELHKLGVEINCFDVGGGLGIDYDGNHTQSDCSVNYSLGEYASTVVWGIGQACREYNLPHPLIISESGRATTAHHAVLVTNVIGVERYEPSTPLPPRPDAPRILHSMWETWQELCNPMEKYSLRAWLHESQFDLAEVHTQYTVGLLDLKQRAYAEQLHLALCLKISEQLNPNHRAQRAIIDELQERLADKLYLNFSLFQSLPDAWGINQLFPVLPLERLHEPPTRRAVLLDITCDSDGAIESYIDGDGIASTMPLAPYDPQDPPLIGFFLVGAYQETLGNMHNLFGDTASVEVLIENGEISWKQLGAGDTVADMLEYVRFDPKELLARYQVQMQASNIEPQLQAQFLAELESGINGYTYLEEN